MFSIWRKNFIFFYFFDCWRFLVDNCGFLSDAWPALAVITRARQNKGVRVYHQIQKHVGSCGKSIEFYYSYRLLRIGVKIIIRKRKTKMICPLLSFSLFCVIFFGLCHSQKTWYSVQINMKFRQIGMGQMKEIWKMICHSLLSAFFCVIFWPLCHSRKYGGHSKLTWNFVKTNGNDGFVWYFLDYFFCIFINFITAHIKETYNSL